MTEHTRPESKSIFQPRAAPDDPPRVALILQKHSDGVPYKNTNPLLGLAAAVVVISSLAYLEGTFGRVGFWGFLCLFLVFAVIVSMRMKHRHRPERMLAPEELSPPRSSGRLTARGKIEELSHLADIEDVPFEPVIVERYTTSKSFYSVILVGLFAAMALSCGFSNVMPIRQYISGLALGIGTAIYWFFARLRPVYYRIVPGRMDVMQFSVVSGKATLLRRFDLGDAEVEVSFKDQKVFLRSAKDGSEAIAMSSLTEPYRFARAILHAAICTSPAPPLPDDQLLG